MISSYLADKLLRLSLRGEAFSPASVLYVALYSSEMSADGTGGTELSGGGYARMAINVDTTDWAVPSGKEIANAVKVPIPAATAPWDEAVYAALIDTSSGAGNVYYHDFLDDPFTHRVDGSGRSLDIGAIVSRFV